MSLVYKIVASSEARLSIASNIFELPLTFEVPPNLPLSFEVPPNLPLSFEVPPNLPLTFEVPPQLPLNMNYLCTLHTHVQI
jgi:hypothetical protein